MIRETLLTNWNFMRILRLVLGIYIAVQAVETQSMLSAIFAVFLRSSYPQTRVVVVRAAVPIKKIIQQTEEIEYEEVK